MQVLMSKVYLTSLIIVLIRHIFWCHATFSLFMLFSLHGLHEELTPLGGAIISFTKNDFFMFSSDRERGLHHKSR